MAVANDQSTNHAGVKTQTDLFLDTVSHERLRPATVFEEVALSWLNLCT